MAIQLREVRLCTVRCISILFLICASGGAAFAQPNEYIKSKADTKDESNQPASTIDLDPKIKTWLGNFNDPSAASEIMAQPFLTALLSDYFEIIGEPTAFQRAINDNEPICLSACREFDADVILIGDKATSSDFVRMLMNTRYGYVEEASRRWSALARIDQILRDVGVDNIRLTNEDAEYFAVEFAKIVKASNALSGMEYPHIVQLTSVAFQSAADIDRALSIPGQQRSEENRRAYTFSQKSRVVKSKDLTGLVLRKGETPQSLIARYLINVKRDPRIADNLVLIKDIVSDFGRRHIQLQEQIGDTPLYDSEIKIAVAANNEVLQIIENLPASYSDQYARLSVDRNVSLGNALERNFPGRNLMDQMVNGEFPINEDSFFYQHPWPQKIMLRRVGDALEEGHRWFVWERENNQLYEIVTDQNGRVVEDRSRTAVDAYRVFNPDPQTAAATDATGPGAGNTQSPSGWLAGAQFSTNIKGNNVHAYLGGGAAGAPIGGNNAFLANADFTQEPDVGATRAASVQSLFYWTNHAHDKLYEYGFREADRNFQQNNFGLGGLGNDAVLAEAQAGRQNNAFFATPVDGQAPKMTMHIYTSPSPDRDSSFDTDIIWHEYGHGLTWRMIGNMGGRTSGAIGEGMSDVLAILMNEDDANAEYTANNADGNRRHRYAGYPKSLRDYNNGVVFWRGQPYYYSHDNGEIYAAAIWRLWEIAQRNSLHRDVLMKYLIDGLRFTPQDPNYLDMRDGILNSTPDYIDCWVWEAFADFGMGEGASFSPAAITESNTTPACNANPPKPATHSTTPEYCPSVENVRNGHLTPAGAKRFKNFTFTDPRMDQSKRHATRFKEAVVKFGGIAAVNLPPQDSQVYCYYLTELRDAQNDLIVLELESDEVNNVTDTATSLRFVSDPPTGRYYRRHYVEYEYACRHKHNTCAF